MELSHIILLIIAMVITGGIVTLLIILNHREKIKHPDKPADPLTRSILLSAVVSFVLFFGEIFGALPPGFNKEKWWLHLLAFGVLMAIFLYTLYKRNPLTYDKQKKIVMNLISQEYMAEEYSGEAYSRSIKLYKFTEHPGTVFRTATGSFLVEVWDKQLMFKVLVQINVYSGVILHLQDNPPVALINRILGKESKSQGDAVTEAFDETNRDDTRKEVGD